MKRNNEQFKRLFRLFLAGIMVAAQTAVFAYLWLREYNSLIERPFVLKGHWFVCALYAIYLIIFLVSFDGIKYGRYRKSNIIISQILATLFTAFISYVQIVLMAAEFVTVLPVVAMLCIDVLIVFVMTLVGDFWFGKVFPPKKILIVYDQYDPELMLHKLGSRRDKFVLWGIMNVSDGLEEVEAEAKKKSYQGIIIYDVHAEIRNKLLKICFENDIRAYSTAKISDVLV
ncbi:MAG: hypothetical protein IKU45_06750, partial [Clostridia bacterium]|nr:hypothetical protein [Clostridia bacterium]